MLADPMFQLHGHPADLVLAAFVAGDIARVGLPGIRLGLLLRQGTRVVEFVGGAVEEHLDIRPIVERGEHARLEKGALRAAVLAPAVERGTGQGGHDPGAVNDAASLDLLLEGAERTAPRAKREERLVEIEPGLEINDTAGGVAVESRGVAPLDLDTIDGRQVGQVKGGATVRLGNGNSIRQDPDPAGDARIGTFAAAACAIAADHDPDVL
ncbi:MAG: hypothetical protein FD129_381 [bacterium]|nr:MAG: hypothetical protein FD129_381 [bacterium]